MALGASACDVEIKNEEKEQVAFDGTISEGSFDSDTQKLKLSLVYEGCDTDSDFEVKEIDSCNSEETPVCSGKLWLKKVKGDACKKIERIVEVSIAKHPYDDYFLKLTENLKITISKVAMGCTDDAQLVCVEIDGRYEQNSVGRSGPKCEFNKLENQVDFNLCQDSEKMEPFDGKIETASFNKETNALTLDLLIVDGCYPDQIFDLKMLDMCGKSYPEQCKAELLHSFDKEAASTMKCSQNVQKQIVLKIKEHPADYYHLSISGKISVLIDTRDQVQCTSDAKTICVQDGSSYKELGVGRQGPNCQFPEVENQVEMSYCIQ